MARTWTPRVEYVSTRTRGITYTVKTMDDRPAPYALADCGCNCPGWRFSRTTPRTCNHVRRFVSTDQFGERPTVASFVRRCLADAGHTAKFSEFQLGVLEQVFEARLARRPAATAAATARAVASSAPARAGLRQIVLDE